MWFLIEISAFFFVLTWILGLLRCIQMQINGDVCEIWAVFYVWGCMAFFRVYAFAVLIARARSVCCECSEFRLRALVLSAVFRHYGGREANYFAFVAVF